MLKGRLILGLSYSHFDLIDLFKDKGIRYFFTFPAQNWEELRLFKKLGVCYAYLVPPLTHSLAKVKSIGIPIRAIPNIAHDPYLPYENGIVGGWIRPEDTEIYEEYIDVFDLDASSIAQEKALLNIYQSQNWPGPLEDLIQDLKVHAINRMIPSDVGLARTNCGQKCLIPGERCNICANALKLANKERVVNYTKSVQS